MLPSALTEACAGALSAEITGFEAASGGCINNGGRLRTSIGDYFLKWNSADKFPLMFETEAAGLDLLLSAGEIGLPKPIAHGLAGNHAFLLMEYLEAASPVPDQGRRFGSALAALHKHTDSRFGLDHNNYIGSLPQSNRQHKKGINFFIKERLQPQIEIGKGSLPLNLLKKFETLFNELGTLLPNEAQALVHGDLWGGNYMTGPDGQAWLIDPAVHFGSREAELAFTYMFGGFDDDFYRSYQEAFPLDPGFDQRIEIYNLYPSLVHLNLFGNSYLGGIKRVLQKF